VSQVPAACQRQPGSNDDLAAPNFASIRDDAYDHAVVVPLESRHRLPQAETGTTRASELEGEAPRFEPAIALPVPGVHDVLAQIGKPLARLPIIEQLDVGQAPRSLGLHQGDLCAGALFGAGYEKVALVAKAEVDPLLEIVEEIDAFANERHLFRIVELQPKRSGRDWRSECRKCRPLVNDNRPQAGSLSKKGRRATDDAPAYDDEVGAFVR